MGGFEGADHVNSRGEPLDMVSASGHLDRANEDYARLAALGLRTVRESVGWRLTETAGQFDFSRVVCLAQLANDNGIQILWTLMHYGTPPDVSLLDDAFCQRYVAFAVAAARALRPLSDHAPIYTPINEIGFVSWAVCESDLFHPYVGHFEGKGGESWRTGFEVKCRLVSAALQAMNAIRQEDPRARFMHIEPLVHAVAPADAPELVDLATEVRSHQWQVWDLLAGRLMPELGGRPSQLDLLGVNHYHNSQWEVGTEARLHWHLGDPRRLPLAHLLQEAWARYGRPLIVAETSHVGEGRVQWLHDVAEQVRLARSAGVPVDGLCLYPIVDRPDWNNSSHWHNSGLWDVDHSASEEAFQQEAHGEQGVQGAQGPHRQPVSTSPPKVAHRLHFSYAKALRRWTQRLPGPHQEPPCPI